jgi:hypothetical protein
MESFKGKPLPFGQMQIEIHLNYEPDRASAFLLPLFARRRN